MMYLAAFCCLLVVFAATSVYGQKSFADVQSCKSQALNDCAQQCVSSAPADKQAAIQQCFANNAAPATPADGGISSCLAQAGITKCFKHKGHGHRGGGDRGGDDEGRGGDRGHEGGRGGGRGGGKNEGGNNGNGNGNRFVRQADDGANDNKLGDRGRHGDKEGRGHGNRNPALKEFFQCKHQCIDAKKCDDGCDEEPDDATRQAFRNCKKQGGGQWGKMKPLMECLKSIP